MTGNTALLTGGVPVIDFFGCAGDYAELSKEIMERTAAVLASGQVLSGADVAEFETTIAAMTGRAHAVAVGSGTDALFFALVTAGIGPGDEVLVPAISFIATASAIVRTGARPVFVDIGDDAAIDLCAAERLVGSRTRALLNVPLFGAMNDPEELERFAARHNLALIEDFAQSLGASFGKRRAGSAGLAATTSFDPTKVLGAPGSGGALVTDDKALAFRVRSLRLHGKSGSCFVEPGYNSQLPSLAAAILNVKLSRFAQWTERRARIASRYIDALSGLPVGRPAVDARVSHIWHKFVILSGQRDALATALKAEGIPLRIHYERPMCDERMFAPWGATVNVPKARAYCAQTLSLPIHSHMSEDAVSHVIAALGRFFA